MTSEEWSLKDKEYDVLMSDYDVELTAVYKKDDIETALQSVEDDIESYFKEILDGKREFNIEYMQLDILKIINRRFGRKENE